MKEFLRALSCFVRDKYQPGGFPAEFLAKHYTNSSDERTAVRGVIFMCDGRMPHGGLSDRLLGLLSAYKMARVLRRKFYINWNHPFRLSDYLIANEVTWEVSPQKICYDRNNAFPVFVMWNSRNRRRPRFNDTIKFLLFLLKRKRQFHIYSNTRLVSDEELTRLYHRLFKPSELLSTTLELHQREIGPGYESYSFRFQSLLGDFKDTMTSPLDKEAALDLMRRCGEKLIELVNLQPQGTRALVASDSIRFLDYAAKLDSRIYVIPGEVSHSDISSGKESSDVWLKTFVDQHMIMGATRVHLLRTDEMYNSGFPEFAAKVGGRPYFVHEF